MQPNISTLLLSTLVVFFLSCEKNIEFKGKVTDPLLVMNGILTPDSVVSIRLTQSRFVLGEMAPIKHIPNATVSLFVNNEPKEELVHVEEGIYRGTYYPAPGDDIRIEVTAEGFRKVSSQTRIPDRINVTLNDSTVTIKEEESVSPYQPETVTKITSRNMQVQLKLTDAANKENYYYVKAIQYYYSHSRILREDIKEIKLSEVLKNNITDSGNIFEGIFNDEGEGEDGMVSNLFTDLFVDGKDILFDFSFYNMLESSDEYAGSTWEEGLTVESIIEIGEISKDMYQYLISGSKAKNAEDYGPFGEPAQVYTNIENGVGILGAHTTYRFVSRFETDFLPNYFPY